MRFEDAVIFDWAPCMINWAEMIFRNRDKHASIT
jgi:hypothetical protein